MEKGQRIKEECYDKYRRSMEGAREFAECIMREKENLAKEEQRGKFAILHMEMSSERVKDFNLTDSLSKFITNFKLEAEGKANIANPIWLTCSLLISTISFPSAKPHPSPSLQIILLLKQGQFNPQINCQTL